MRLWCDKCSEAVEADERRHREVMDVNVLNSVYEYSTYICPHCGSEVYEEPEHCCRCGEEISPDENMCECCLDEINETITTLQCDGKYSKKEVLEHLDVFLGEEM